MCAPCYGTWWRQNNQTAQVCQHCGSTFNAGRKHAYCSPTCQRTVASNSPARIASLRATMAARPKAPVAPPYDPRGAIRRAYEQGDWEALLAEIRARASVTPLGCWLWGGQVRGGYPVASVKGRKVFVHRLSLEAKHRAPLGTQLAHHTCAMTQCVNPEHLQPATHAENVGEMKARVSYEMRIADLERELARLDPTNPLLTHVQLGRAR